MVELRGFVTDVWVLVVGVEEDVVDVVEIGIVVGVEVVLEARAT